MKHKTDAPLVKVSPVGLQKAFEKYCADTLDLDDRYFDKRPDGTYLDDGMALGFSAYAEGYRACAENWRGTLKPLLNV